MLDSNLKEHARHGDLGAVVARLQVLCGESEHRKQQEINKTDEDGRTLLHHASLFGHLRVVSFLADLRANGAVKDKNGKTAWDIAASHEMRELLLLTHAEMTGRVRHVRVTCTNEGSVHIKWAYPEEGVLPTRFKVVWRSSLHQESTRFSKEVDVTSAAITDLHPSTPYDIVVFAGTPQGFEKAGSAPLRHVMANADMRITVTQPSVSDPPWKAGSAHVIRWSTCGNVSTVSIVLMCGHRVSLVIAEETQNTGEHKWTIPLETASSDNYRIRVTPCMGRVLMKVAEHMGGVSDVFGISAPWQYWSTWKVDNTY